MAKNFDPDLEPVHLPRYYEGYIAAPHYAYPNYTTPINWTVYTYPYIVIWEFDNANDAELCAKELNEGPINE